MLAVEVLAQEEQNCKFAYAVDLYIEVKDPVTGKVLSIIEMNSFANRGCYDGYSGGSPLRGCLTIRH